MSDQLTLTDLLISSDAQTLLCMAEFLDKNIIIYGAGSGFYSFSTFILSKYKIEPSLILDKKFETVEYFHGIKASSLKNYEATPDELENAIVIVSIGTKLTYDAVFDQLKSKFGFHNVIWAFDLFEYSLHYTPISFMDNCQQLIQDNIEDIVKAYKLLADEESRNVFKKILTLYYSKKNLSIPSRPISEQYFPEDIELNKGLECFIDCGAYKGDTVKQLTEKFASSLKQIVCFEPDPNHYAELIKQIHLSPVGEFITFPCGIYNDEVVLQVNLSDTNSNISKHGTNFIQTVALDHVLHGLQPTYIKMDIEGIEKEALCGAEKMIKTYEPDLAISLYHLVEHLWTLPNIIESFGVKYDFYIRNYTSHISETVLYATKR